MSSTTKNMLRFLLAAGATAKFADPLPKEILDGLEEAQGVELRRASFNAKTGASAGPINSIMIKYNLDQEAEIKDLCGKIAKHAKLNIKDKSVVEDGKTQCDNYLFCHIKKVDNPFAQAIIDSAPEYTRVKDESNGVLQLAADKTAYPFLLTVVDNQPRGLQNLERTLESFPSASTDQAISTTLAFSSPDGGMGNLRMTTFHDWKVGMVVNPALVDMDWAEMSAYKTGSVIPEEIKKDGWEQDLGEFGGTKKIVCKNKEWNEHLQMGRECHAMGQTVFVPNMAKYELPNRLEQSKLGFNIIAKAEYNKKGSFSTFAVNTWRGAYDSKNYRVKLNGIDKFSEKTFTGPYGGYLSLNLNDDKMSGNNVVFSFNEGLAQQKINGANPVAGIFLDVSSGKNVKKDGDYEKNVAHADTIKELKKIIVSHNYQARPLNLYVYDRRITESSTLRVIPATADQKAALAALEKYEKSGFSVKDSEALAEFTGFPAYGEVTEAQKMEIAAGAGIQNIIQVLKKSMKAGDSDSNLALFKNVLRFSYGDSVKTLPKAFVSVFDAQKTGFVAKYPAAQQDQARLVWSNAARRAVVAQLGRDSDEEEFAQQYMQAEKQSGLPAFVYNYDTGSSGKNYFTKAKPFMLEFLGAAK